MEYNNILKERLETLYKETSLWERHAQETDYTKIERHNTDGTIGLVDITTASNFESLKMMNDGNYRWFFEQLKHEMEIEPTLYDYYCLYVKLLKDLTGNLTDNMYYIIEQKEADFTFYDSVDAHDKEVIKLEIVFNEYKEKFNTSIDMTIKEFPKNVTSEKEKEILNHLANNFYIKRSLTESGLLPLFGKNGTKRLLEEFYKYAPEYKDFQAFNFIKSSIETNLPDATLQNYCREVRKDTVKI
jgi:hypothetical protein